MLVVNLFGAPGSGKSTAAAYIFAMLKMKGIHAELITEFAKDKVWEGNEEVFKNQAYIFGKQSFKISRCKDKVDVIVVDSPLPMSILYNNDPVLTENFNRTVMDVFNSYNNVSYLLKRVAEYETVGRMQTAEESDALCEPLKNMLRERGVQFTELPGNTESCDKIVKDVLGLLGMVEKEWDENMNENHVVENEADKDDWYYETGREESDVLGSGSTYYDIFYTRDEQDAFKASKEKCRTYLTRYKIVKEDGRKVKTVCQAWDESSKTWIL